MKLKRVWLESVQHLDEPVLEALLTEQPHTRFWDNVPPEYKVLNSGGFVDLGFENLGLAKPEWLAISRAFAGTGVKIPGGKWRMRVERPMVAVIEPQDGSETAELPPHWLSAVMVLDGANKPVFIGDKVREDQTGPWDHKDYHRVPAGWLANSW